jgi:type II secretory ATPase GspE/PulE/Tfp pilus assembly ATPase PilB-like protein
MSAATSNPSDARVLADQLLNDAIAQAASDIHLEPTADGYEVRYRVDGLLQTVARYESALGRSVVTRLMVLAQMLTYRLDIPQEGRLSHSNSALPSPIDLRVAIMPTTHGLRAAVRLPAGLLHPLLLDSLGLPENVLQGLKSFAASDTGMLLFTGPAGSGKTTTIYALLTYIAQQSSGISIIALEDPVERDLPGVTQIEVSRFGELTYERALRSILRQDPQVLMLGEIRDAATASLAIQAALSGHRIVSTLHAGTPGGAVARLVEMGLESYQLTSALFGIVSQRLLRRSDGAGGYAGRVPVAEMATIGPEARKAILSRSDASEIGSAFGRQSSYVPMRQSAERLVAAGITDLAEVDRVLGINKERND